MKKSKILIIIFAVVTAILVTVAVVILIARLTNKTPVPEEYLKKKYSKEFVCESILSTAGYYIPAEDVNTDNPRVITVTPREVFFESVEDEDTRKMLEAIVTEPYVDDGYLVFKREELKKYYKDSVDSILDDFEIISYWRDTFLPSALTLDVSVADALKEYHNFFGLVYIFADTRFDSSTLDNLYNKMLTDNIQGVVRILEGNIADVTEEFDATEFYTYWCEHPELQISEFVVGDAEE